MNGGGASDVNGNISIVHSSDVCFQIWAFSLYDWGVFAFPGRFFYLPGIFLFPGLSRTARAFLLSVGVNTFCGHCISAGVVDMGIIGDCGHFPPLMGAFLLWAFHVFSCCNLIVKLVVIRCKITVFSLSISGNALGHLLFHFSGRA
jgi:hypothetical protein